MSERAVWGELPPDGTVLTTTEDLVEVPSPQPRIVQLERNSTTCTTRRFKDIQPIRSEVLPFFTLSPAVPGQLVATA